VETNGGRIWSHNNEEGGAMFLVSLPAAAETVS
jgi:K+-sensing histidine kinase KdpD